jgi:hypothetical protein
MARNKSRSITARPRVVSKPTLPVPSAPEQEPEEREQIAIVQDGRRLLIGVIGLLVAFGALGLGLWLNRDRDDHIRDYTTARPETKTRLLAAIVPRPKETWFFKLVGPLDVVKKNAGTFDAFVKSAHFTDRADTPIEWKVPKGWKKGEETPGRYATFYLDKAGKPPQLTVVKLGDKAGSLLANVNRWRKQDLGLRPVPEEELKKFTRDLQVDGLVATRVDMRGPGFAAAPRPMRPAGHLPGLNPRAPHPFFGAEKTKLKYDPPAGWENLPDPPARMGIHTHYEAHFGLREGGEEVRIKTMRSGRGDALTNVNRWQGMLGQPELTAKQLEEMTQVVKVDGAEGILVELTGKPGPRQEKILAVFVVHEGETWVFTLMGPAKLVTRHTDTFENFLKSVHF